MKAFLKDNIVEIIVIVLAVAVLGFFWNKEKNKPAPKAPATLQSQVEQAQ